MFHKPGHFEKYRMANPNCQITKMPNAKSQIPKHKSQFPEIPKVLKVLKILKTKEIQKVPEASNPKHQMQNATSQNPNAKCQFLNPRS